MVTTRPMSRWDLDMSIVLVTMGLILRILRLIGGILQCTVTVPPMSNIQERSGTFLMLSDNVLLRGMSIRPSPQTLPKKLLMGPLTLSLKNCLLYRVTFKVYQSHFCSTISRNAYAVVVNPT